MSTVFNTVFAGVTVFVIGQIIIKFILEPILDFKSLLGKITQVFLRNQGQILTANADKEIQNSIFILASELLQKRQSVMCYKSLHRIYGLPSYSNVLEAAKLLNFIGNTVSPEKSASDDGLIKIFESMKEIDELLKINTGYNK
jgi:hypothetical protein